MRTQIEKLEKMVELLDTASGMIEEVVEELKPAESYIEAARRVDLKDVLATLGEMQEQLTNEIVTLL